MRMYRMHTELKGLTGSKESRHRRWAHRRYLAEISRAIEVEDENIEEAAIESTDCTAIMEALMHGESATQAIGYSRDWREVAR